MTSEEESTEEGDGTDALNFGADVDDGVVGITPAQSRAAASAAAQSIVRLWEPRVGNVVISGSFFG
jgi:phage baseplate assembly protein W